MSGVPHYPTPDGHELPFISQKLHSVAGVRVWQTMLYPSREMIEARIRAVPAGDAVSLADIKAGLAKEHGVAAVCPVTTQRLVREIAEAAAGAWQGGDRTATPFWRVVDPDKPSTRRLPGGGAFVRDRRLAERAT